ncbi:MAG: GspE/PulE family protein [Planctomycetota bacterium]|jgi:type II secretory ATPase GspE/PulE/Tfp pilus assembly ATPase PilB-like protein
MSAVAEILTPELTVAETGQAISACLQQDELRISELVDVILRKAVLTDTSDVHIESTHNGLRIRFRVDGVFLDLGYFPIEIHQQVVSRIKVLADLVSHKKEVSQEGRLSVEMSGKRRDFRVSILPTVSGEKVVMRMFNPSLGLFDLNKLGYSDKLVEQLEELLFGLAGMVVLTGPSGSGKTTTLYACLQRLYQEKDQFASLCTIEDPVEYEFGLFSQIPVNRKVGLDFSGILSAVLRQDPEVIMIGEIRDVETCEIALRAGLTGHLVLTTIHSGSACEVVTRLLNMDIEPFVVASALTGVVAQRLARRVCEDCAHPYSPLKVHIDFVERALNRTELKFMKGRGCKECGFTGFRGRVPLAELLRFDDQLRSLVLERPSTATLKRFAVGRGMGSLLEDGLDKVAQGLTTLDEVFRVVGARQGGSK